MEQESSSMVDAEAERDAQVERIELLISRLLLWGVLSSFVLIVAGTTVTFIHHPHYLHSPELLHPLVDPGASVLHTVRDVGHGLMHFDGDAIVAVGLLLLILTPVMRVAVSIVAFLHQRDMAFVVITSVVLALLLISFALGKAGG
jgi:uncharacterized membrane protein